ncbi:hypothetical protein BJX64DRAFT_124443 [Aspergillus heterothallicus]
MSSDFLFVNFQDAKSQRLALARKKHAFLQTKRHQRRREEGLQRLKTSIQRPVSDELTPEPPTDARRSSHNEPAHNNASLVACSMGTAVGSGRMDPFSSFGLPSTDNIDPYFYHYNNSLARAIYPFAADGMSNWWWQRCMGQPALLYVILATSAFHRSCLEQTSGGYCPNYLQSSADSLQLRTKSIRGLQVILNNLTDASLEAAILIVANLICVEAGAAQIHAVDAHIDGLRRLIYLRGGLDTLDDLTISTIYCCTYMKALLTRSLPAFPMSVTWRNRVLDRSRVAQSSCKTRELSSCGTRFFTSPWSQYLQAGMNSSLRLFQRLTLCTSTQRPSGLTPLDDSLINLATHELLCLSFVGSAADFHEPLRVALLLYALTRILSLQWIKATAFVVEDLRRSLLSSLPVLQTTATDLLFWILFTGGMASGGLECRRWFVARLRETADRLEITDWNTALALLDGFLFLRRPGDSCAEALWDEIRAIENSKAMDLWWN